MESKSEKSCKKKLLIMSSFTFFSFWLGKKKKQKLLEALNGRNGVSGKVNKIKLASLGGLKRPLVAGRVSSDLLRWAATGFFHPSASEKNDKEFGFHSKLKPNIKGHISRCWGLTLKTIYSMISVILFRNFLYCLDYVAMAHYLLSSTHYAKLQVQVF